MAVQTVFRRYELKYLLSKEQQAAVLAAMQPHMQIDAYGKTTLRNLYFDTPDYLLIRRSIEKPLYKEKLRLRCYGPIEATDSVFVEVKKKYDSVVYKRRVQMPLCDAMAWLAGKPSYALQGQIAKEIDYLLQFYHPLAPTVFLAYDRVAYFDPQRSDLRVTFDNNILVRQTQLDLSQPVWGDSILPQDQVLMEIKCAGGIPLWMTKVLSEQRIFKTSFSKYGTAYARLIFNNEQAKQKEDICDERLVSRAV